MMQVDVVCSDDRLRAAIADCLAGRSDMSLGFATANLRDALKAAGVLPPQALIIDGDEKEMIGEQLGQLQAIWPESPVLLLIGMADMGSVVTLLHKQVQGYLLKENLRRGLPLALRLLGEGELYLDSTLLRPLLRRASLLRSQSVPLCVTRQEREVLDLVLAGLSYKEIANRCFLTADTLNAHIRNLFSKLKVHSKTELITRFR
ncbi:response regulator transcription factor [Flaviaesturariibacter aridisoli]|uniref:Response regulator transcription factor n=1 Tax=Flaviaesturariibacter aridisoli TaxID=2545761 RepID=A0A4R4E6W7_9BACT|nr:response regulator transcription factor [Flaviaesturariibacter aridisoli]TCZ73445.1 response regulator transcription factor [Flaviaesturariibacter aridisoli]